MGVFSFYDWEIVKAIAVERKGIYINDCTRNITARAGFFFFFWIYSPTVPTGVLVFFFSRRNKKEKLSVTSAGYYRLVDQFNLTPRDIFHSFCNRICPPVWIGWHFSGLFLWLFGRTMWAILSTGAHEIKNQKKSFIIISEYQTELESSDFFLINEFFSHFLVFFFFFIPSSNRIPQSGISLEFLLSLCLSSDKSSGIE